jgi:hypothetical protein
VAKVDTGTVQDIFGVNQLYLTIVQESFIVELYVEPTDDIIFANTGSSTSITIDSNADWELDYPWWVTPSVTSGSSGTTTVTFTAGQNGPTDRSGEITVYAGSKTVTINVFQPFYIPAYITVTPTAYTFPYSASSAQFVVDSFPEWTAEVIATAETHWGEDIAIEATLVVQNPTTLNLGQTGVIVNGVVQHSSTYRVATGGTYVLLYPYVSSTAPIIGSNYLTEVSFYETITELPSACLSGSTNLTSVTIYGEIEAIPTNCFAGCSSLRDITIYSNTAPEVDDTVFVGIATGGTLTFPNGADYSSWLTGVYPYLGYYYWNGGRPALIKAYFNFTNNNKDIGYSSAYAEYGGTAVLCDENGVALPSSATSKSGSRIYYVGEIAESGLTTLYIRTPKIIPEQLFLADIGQSSVYNNAALVSVEIPEGITEIDEWAFYGLKQLSSVTLPNSITRIGIRCFYQCSALTSVDIPSKIKTIEDYAFYQSVGIQGSLVFPGTLQNIGELAFGGLSNLTSISFENSISSLTLGRGVFSNCTGLSSVEFKSGTANGPVSFSGSFCFANCTSLQSIIIPDNATYISDYCFSNCTALASVTIGSGVSGMGGNNCFNKCSSLTRITSKPSKEPRAAAFSNFTNRNGVFTYPEGGSYSNWISRFSSLGWTIRTL